MTPATVSLVSSRVLTHHDEICKAGFIPPSGSIWLDCARRSVGLFGQEVAGNVHVFAPGSALIGPRKLLNLKVPLKKPVLWQRFLSCPVTASSAGNPCFRLMSLNAESSDDCVIVELGLFGYLRRDEPLDHFTLQHIDLTVVQTAQARSSHHAQSQSDPRKASDCTAGHRC